MMEYLDKLAENRIEQEEVPRVTSKLLSAVTNQSKLRKDLCGKHLGNSIVLLKLLESSENQTIVVNIVKILVELLSKKGSGKLGRFIVQNKGSNTLFEVVAREAKQHAPDYDLVFNLHYVLYKIRKKDKKLASKARLNNTLVITCALLKQKLKEYKSLAIVLQLLAIYCKNAINACQLGKLGLMNTLMTIIPDCTNKRERVLRLGLEIVHHLCRAMPKVNTTKFLQSNGMPTLILIYLSWSKRDPKRFVNLRRTILNLFKTLVSTKACRDAFVERQGPQILYETCIEARDKLPEALITLATMIIRKCCDRDLMPLLNAASAVAFPLPYSPFHSPHSVARPQRPHGSSDAGSGRVPSASHQRARSLPSMKASLGRDGRSESEESEEDIDMFRPRIVHEAGTVSTAVPFEWAAEEKERFRVYFPELEDLGYTPLPQSEPVPYEYRDDSSHLSQLIASVDDLSLRSASSSSSTILSTKQPEKNESLCSDSQQETLALPPRQDRADPNLFSFDRVDLNVGLRQRMYAEVAHATKSLIKWDKLAYPEYRGHNGPLFDEPLCKREPAVVRDKVLEDLDRVVHSDTVLNCVVYDFDELLKQKEDGQESVLTNFDEIKVAESLENMALKFNSFFECGNLRKAIQVRPYEYDLILNADVNTDHNHQWFYFEVSNMIPNVEYRFNIINCEKVNSQFNFGMQPLVYSVLAAVAGQPQWRRVGSKLCYYRNHFTRIPPHTFGNSKEQFYYTASFTMTFESARDICYFAYHYPYSYSLLKLHLKQWSLVPKEDFYYNEQVLCTTLGGNDCPVITITSRSDVGPKDYIFISARVHPGETNSSWLMKGIIDYLLSPDAKQARELFVFKIVPMLNIDGVINGNHRCGLAGEDLNRRWSHPCPILHPTIFHAKGLLYFLCTLGKKPLVFCDIHGHSRRKNVFLYGCDTKQMFRNCAPNIDPGDKRFRILPRLLQQLSPIFALKYCEFKVDKIKESSARVVVWAELGVTCSYTMEATYTGCDAGPYKNLHIGPRELEDMGPNFIEALVALKEKLRSDELHDLTADIPDRTKLKMMKKGSAMAAEDGSESDETTSEESEDLDNEDDV